MADLNERRAAEVTVKQGRVEARRDRDRILYSTEFRRLAGVTQVASATEKLLIHNRITHSTKVEQVGMAIVASSDAREAQGGNQLGPDVEWRVAAAGLGHDLGHPPFGHIGEEQLHALVTCGKHRTQRKSSTDDEPCSCLLEDGFEGNAQSFRIVTKLSVRANDRGDNENASVAQYRQGLNLTRGSMAALTKYPWVRGGNPKKPKKWGAYDCDKVELEWALQDAKKNDQTQVLEQSIEAQIMDWADDITYAVHDIDDFFRLGIVPLDVLRNTKGTEFAEFMAYARESVSGHLHGVALADANTLVENSFGWFPQRPYYGLPSDMAHINRVVSDLIHRFVSNSPIENGVVSPPAQLRYLNEILKQLTWYYVIDNPSLSTIQAGQKKVLCALFEHVKEILEHAYMGEPVEKKYRLERRIPTMLKYYVDHALHDPGCKRAYQDESTRLVRGVLDFLSSLTDLGAYKLYARLTGDANVSMLEPSVAY